MAQNTVNYSNNPTGPQLLDDYLAKDQENHLTCNSGIQRPSYAQAGSFWLDTSSTPWILNFYDGTSDIAIGSLNASTHVFSVQGVDTSSFVNKTGDETIAGVKTFTSSPVVPTPTSTDNSTRVSTTAFVKTALTSKADDNSAVHKTGDETITGDKTFTGSLAIPAETLVSKQSNNGVDEGGELQFEVGTNSPLLGNVKVDVYEGRFRVFGTASNSDVREIINADIENNNLRAPASDAIGSVVITTGINKAQNGYVKLGNGIIIQWGKTPNIGNTNTTCTLPTPFTTTNYSVTAITSAAFNENCIALTGKTTTNFTLVERGLNGGAHNVPNYFLAIGY